MGNLLDGIRKLKERRQESQRGLGSVDDKPDELTELVSLYSAIVEKSQAGMAENSTATNQDKTELERMEKSFSFRWDNLSGDRQKEIVDRLLAKGRLPEIVRQALDIFNGTVVGIL